MRRLRLLCLAVVAVSIAVLAPSAVATPPTIVSPANGAQVTSGYTGPVQVTWLEAGEMKVEASGPGGYSSLVGPITVTPAQVGGTFDYSLSPMNAPGTYTISAGRMDGSETPVSVGVTVPEPPPPPSSASIVSPSFGATVLAPWAGPIRVRWDQIAHPEASYVVKLDFSTVCSFAGTDLTPGETTSCAVGFNPGLGEKEITVHETSGPNQELIGYSVVYIEPHLAIRSLTLSPATFYPYVREGFRDRARLAFSLNKEANLWVVVRNTRGNLVRRVDLGGRSQGVWDWNGRTDGGSLAPVGRYRVTLEARALGELRRATREVRIGRGFRTRYDSKSFCGGCGPGIVETSGNCFIEFDRFYDGDIFLDCWGGNYAITTWVFRIPASAFNIRKSIRGEVMCCAPGEVASAGVRRNARTYVVAAGVSGYRAWDIRSVRIRYAYRVRI
jgi:hypothetical protein